MRIVIPAALLLALAACAPQQQVAQQSPAQMARQIAHEECSRGLGYNTPAYHQCMVAVLANARAIYAAEQPRQVNWGAYNASQQLLRPTQAAPVPYVPGGIETNTYTYRGRTTTCNTTGLPGMQNTNCF